LRDILDVDLCFLHRRLHWMVFGTPDNHVWQCAARF
jgi:hypothetical protein